MSAPDYAEMAERHADLILRAAGSGLRHYTIASTRGAILMAVMDTIEEAVKAGAAVALGKVKADPLLSSARGLLEIAVRLLERGYVSEHIEEERDDYMALVAAVAKAEGRS